MPAGTNFDESTGIVTAGSSAGSFEVTVDSGAVTNYKAALQTRITVYIKEKTPSVYTTEPKAKTGLEYNGSEQKLVSEGTANGGTVKYSLDGTNWTDTVPTGKNARDYTVHYKIEGDATYTGSPEKTLTVTIGHKEVTVSSGITAANKAYDGGTDATVNASGANFAGIVSGDNLTISVTSATFDNANVGENKTVTLTLGTLGGTSVGNYKLATTGNQATTTANITAREVTLTGGINATDRSYVKDNTTVALTKGTLTFTGLQGGETLDVNIPATGTISDADAGNGKTVTYSGVTLANGSGKASNYTLKAALPTVTVNITKETAPTLTDIKLNQRYTVTTEQSKDIGAVMPADAGALTYTKGAESKTGSVVIDSWNVDSTTGKVTYKLSGGKANDTVTLPVIIRSTNYADSTVNVKITLVRGSSGGGGSSAAVAPDMPLLRYGSRGDAVKILQEKLNAKGYSSGNVDGIFGTKTRAAVISFQKANGLGVDGIVGKLTWAKLYDAAPVSVVAPAAQPMLRSGSRGEAVRKLQELLNARGYDCGAVDGIFGVKTRAAVIAFQKANGLSADGIVGPLTWGKLI